MLPADAKTVPDGWKAVLLQSQAESPFIFGMVNVLSDNFNAPNITVFEDEFNRADPAPWFPAFSALLSIANSELVVDVSSTTASRAVLAQAITEGKWRSIQADYNSTRAGSGNGQFEILGANPELAALLASPSFNNGFYKWTFQAPAGAENYCLRDGILSPGEEAQWDNVLIQEIPALDGWVGANNAVLSIVEEQLSITKEAGDPSAARGLRSFPNLAGEDYTFTVDRTDDGSSNPGTATVGISPDSTIGNALTSTDLLPGESAKLSFVGTGSPLNVVLLSTAVVGVVTRFDNVRVDGSNIPLTEANYDRSDWWFAYLGSLGYEGAMNERELAYWEYQLTPQAVANYGAGYGPGYEK